MWGVRVLEVVEVVEVVGGSVVLGYFVADAEIVLRAGFAAGWVVLLGMRMYGRVLVLFVRRGLLRFGYC